MRSRTISLASTAILGCLLLTACGGGGDQSGSADAKSKSAASKGQSTGQKTSGTPAKNVVVSAEANFGDPSEALSPRNGNTCANTRFGLLSIQTSGPVKVWEGKNCTGKVIEINQNDADIRADTDPAKRLTGIRSVRFLTPAQQPPATQPNPGNNTPAKNVVVSAEANFGDPSEALSPRNGNTCAN
ncbi:hypothetical protein ABZ175_34905, partial [Streptomyces cyaneofuscatus]